MSGNLLVFIPFLILLILIEFVYNLNSYFFFIHEMVNSDNVNC
ncbi:hypothetical protein pb186bvf_020954 [Paramecium bursaria]